MKILQLGEETLRKASVPVQNIDEDIKALVAEMFKTMKQSDGIGLAAPQVGRNIRLFVVQVNKNEPMVFINPQIIQTSQQLCSMEEGCLSIPRVFEKVLRPETIVIQYFDINGKRNIIEASGLLARVIQHENDHLDGILFIDKLDEELKMRAERRVAKKRRLHIAAERSKANV